MLREMMLPASMRNVATYEAFNEHPPLRFMRTWVHHLPLTRAFQDVRDWVHSGSLVPPRERELIALRVCSRTGFRVEWSIRVDAYGTKVGLSEEAVTATAIGQPDDPAFTVEDAALIRFVDQLHDTSMVTDEVWNQMSGRWSEPQLLELLFLVGWYHAIAFVGNGAQVDGEEWARAYPEPR
jgi:alkylhydroperoxidase family enzyme